MAGACGGLNEGEDTLPCCGGETIYIAGEDYIGLLLGHMGGLAEVAVLLGSQGDWVEVVSGPAGTVTPMQEEGTCAHHAPVEHYERPIHPYLDGVGPARDGVRVGEVATRLK